MPDQPMNEAPKTETPLESWKEIAIYLKRDVSTLKRWEKEEGLPVHRHLHQARSSVYAYPSELDAWRSARDPQADATPPAWLRPLRAAAVAVAMLMSLFLAGDPGVPPAYATNQAGDVVLRRVWSGNDIDWLGSPSPDGKLLSYVDWSSGDLAIRDLTAGQSRRLTNKGAWTQSNEYAEFSLISPDGKQVAYAWFNEQFYELRLIGVSGGNPRVLYRNEEISYVQPCSWSANGDYLYAVFSRRDGSNQIVRVTVNDGSVRVLKSFDWRYPRGLKLTADGSSLAYDFPPNEERAERDIYLLATDGSRETPLVQHGANDFVLGWAADDGGVLFGSDRTDPPSIWLQGVRDAAASGAPSLVRSNLGRIHPMGMDARGTLYYGSGGGPNVYVAQMDPVTGNLISPGNVTERFVNANAGPDWSPDGKFLSFVSGRGTGFSANVLVIRDVATSEEREIRPAGINVIRNTNQAPPRWSPDGKSLLFLGRDTKGRRGYFQTNVASGQTVPIFLWTEGFHRLPDWSADGKSIFYGTGDDKEKEERLVRHNLKTQQKTIVHRSKHIHAYGRSRDGKWLAIASSAPDDATPVGMATQLLLMPAEGGEARLLRTAPGGMEFTALAWAGDGSSILFMLGNEQGSKPEAWRLPANGGDAQPVHLTLDSRQGPRQLRSLRFHPDGKQVAYDHFDSSPFEIWALENLLPAQRAMR